MLVGRLGDTGRASIRRGVTTQERTQPARGTTAWCWLFGQGVQIFCGNSARVTEGLAFHFSVGPGERYLVHFCSRESSVSRVGYQTVWSESHAVSLQWFYCSVPFCLTTMKASAHTTPVPLLANTSSTLVALATYGVRFVHFRTTGSNFLSTLIPLDESVRNLASSCGFTNRSHKDLRDLHCL